VNEEGKTLGESKMTNLRRRVSWALVLTSATLLAGCEVGEFGDFGQPGPYDRDGHYTILLAGFFSANHADEALAHMEALQRGGWRDLTIIQDEDHSELSWGRYDTIDAGLKDLKKARTHTDAEGARPYALAWVVALPGPDIGPPQWKLFGAKGTYTVVVGYYYNVPEQGYLGRKQAVVDQCELMRKMGYEAYYHHGPARSYITVGTFDDQALQTIREGDIVRTIPADAGMKEILEEFTQLAENGNARVVLVLERIPGTDKAQRKRIVVRSYTVKIPQRRHDDLPSATHNGAGVWKLGKTPRITPKPR